VTAARLIPPGTNMTGGRPFDVSSFFSLAHPLFIRVSGHLGLCISRMELEVIFTFRRNIPPLLSEGEAVIQARGSSRNGPKNNEKKLRWLLERIERVILLWILLSFPQKHACLILVQAACRANRAFVSTPYRCFWVHSYSTPTQDPVSPCEWPQELERLSVALWALCGLRGLVGAISDPLPAPGAARCPA
jgi:hypothetical protein